MTANEQLNIEALTRSIGAIIHNFDLLRPLTSDRKSALEQALYKYHVLFFRNQNLAPKQQRDFALQFGPVHIHPIHSHTTECAEVTVFEFGANINSNEKPNADNWHTDISFSANPPTIGMLCAKTIPKQGGGDTLWANMVEIYKQELSHEMKQILSNLTAQHSFEKTFKLPIKPNSVNIEKYMKTLENNPPINHPIIRQHPHTKENYLYANRSFITKINELNKQESDLLLEYLFSLVNKRPELTCRWKWSENDVCLWDERTTQHYGAPDYWPEHRRLHRCIVLERKD